MLWPSFPQSSSCLCYFSLSLTCFRREYQNTYSQTFLTGNLETRPIAVVVAARGVTHGGDGGDVSPPKFELGGTVYTLSPQK